MNNKLSNKKALDLVDVLESVSGTRADPHRTVLVQGEHKGRVEFVQVATDVIFWVAVVDEDGRPGFTTNLVRESGFLVSTSLINVSIRITHHSSAIR